MEGKRFDALARGLAARRSRRELAKALAAGTAGGVMALVGSSRVGADLCKEDTKVCKKDVQCCSGSCAPSPSGSISTAHSASICCAAGQVQYPTGTCCTPKTCTELGNNCGSVSDECGGTLECGACTAPESCGGAGLDNRCGCTPACDGKQCGADDGCGGTCQTGSCPVCQTCSGGVCQPVVSDPACDGDQACVGGVCQAVCLPLFTECASVDQCCQETPTLCENILPDLKWCCRPLLGSCADVPPEMQGGNVCCPVEGQINNPICVGDVCCLGAANSCSSTDQCCQSPEPLQCVNIPLCGPLGSSGGNRCCKPTGAPCQNNHCECCDGYCVDGVCSPACKPNGSSCNTYSECCSRDCDGRTLTCIP
jgi:hypothetical protein